MAMRKLFRQNNIPTATKGNRELCSFLYATLQSYLPELSKSVVGNTAYFLEKVAFGKVPFINIVDAVLPAKYVSNKHFGHDKEEMQKLIDYHMDDPVAMNKLLVIYQELVEKKTEAVLDYGDADFSKIGTFAFNRLGDVALWDDPTIAHGKFQRAVTYPGGTTHYQLGENAPTTMLKHEVHVDPAPTVLDKKVVTTTGPPATLNLAHI
jgi:hypothetical protein